MKIYLGSIIVWILILKFTEKFSKDIVKDRKDIDYKKYVKNKNKKGVSLIVVSFIPVMRVIFWLVMIWLTFCRQEDLDQLFGERDEQ